ncbi:hypothetical protein BJX99DRAFT_228790, partial [Aspergillus californicus]
MVAYMPRLSYSCHPAVLTPSLCSTSSCIPSCLSPDHPCQKPSARIVYWETHITIITV